MDRIAEWRPVEPAGPDGTAEVQIEDQPASDETRTRPKTPAAKQADSGGWGLIGPVLVALTVVGFTVAAAVTLLVLSSIPKPAVAIDSQETPLASGSFGPRATQSGPPDAGGVVVDVEGAVDKAGVFRLPSGSRVGDAIAAAGGYSPQVDIAAATTKLNLAESLKDGQQIHVPLLGEALLAAAPTATAATAGTTPATAAGPIDINTATADELDTLPGIGPVTAAKIIGARPFASIDDLQQRAVVGASELEKIRSLITVGP